MNSEAINSIVSSLSEQQIKAVLTINDDVIEIAEIDPVVHDELYFLGVVSRISAAGMKFTNLTFDGLRVLSELKENNASK